MPDATDWPYGTTPKPGEPTVVWLGQELLQQTLGDWAEPFGALIPMLGQTPVDVAGLCGTVPPQSDALDPGELAAALLVPFGMLSLPDKIVRSAKLAIWADHCQFTPAPDPVAEPEPVYVPPAPPEVPPDVVLPPPGGGDADSALLKLILELKMHVDWLVENTVTLNYSVGDSFVMQDSGSHSDDDAIGWLVQSLGAPAHLGRVGSDPEVWFSAGWVNFGDQNGWFEHRRLWTRDQLFFPCRFYSRQLGWDLIPDVVGYGRALYKGDGPAGVGWGG